MPVPRVDRDTIDPRNSAVLRVFVTPGRNGSAAIIGIMITGRAASIDINKDKVHSVQSSEFYEP